MQEENDQADELKRILSEIDQQEKNRLRNQVSNLLEEEIDNPKATTQKIDILELPPRKEVHGKYNSVTRLRIEQPFLRFLIVVLVIIIIVLGAYIYWDEELLNLIKNI